MKSNPVQPLIVMPTYNEALNVSDMVHTIFQQGEELEILIVDDGSPDGTAQIVEGLQIKFPDKLHLLQRGKKMGLGTAYLDAFSWALQRNFTHVCQMDGDGSHDPKYLKDLIAKAGTSALAVGSRYIRGGGTQGWSPHRLWISKTANLYAQYVLGLKIHDLTGGLKCYSRRALEALSKHSIYSDGYGFQIETTYCVAKDNIQVHEIPIIFCERRAGKSKFSKRIIIEAAWMVLFLRLKSLFGK